MSETGHPVSPEMGGRSQFIVGPVSLPCPLGWQSIAISDEFELCAHPGLQVVAYAVGPVAITCLGYMLDPEHPTADTEVILSRLAREANSVERLLAHIAGLSGRWVVIFNNGHDLALVTDAAGLRQVYYTPDTHDGGIWCASQSRLIAELLSFNPDERTAEFLAAMDRADRHRAKPRTRWLPGSGSRYAEVKHLAPNHYLDLHTGQKHRFWPAAARNEISLDTAASAIAHLLSQTMLSVTREFEHLALMITGGMDSRLVLAAGREVAEKLEYVTMTHAKSSPIDATIPAAMLQAIGLDLAVVDARSQQLSPGFCEALTRQSLIMNESSARNAEALMSFFNGEKVAITGNLAEVFTGYYQRKLTKQWPGTGEITPEFIMGQMPEMEGHPYALDAVRQWYDELGDTHGYSALDLFYWEQRSGKWLASWLLAYDLIWEDCVVPLNNRRLLEQALSVDPWLRRKPNSELHARLIQHLWPDLSMIASPRLQRPSLQAGLSRLVRRGKKAAKKAQRARQYRLVRRYA